MESVTRASIISLVSKDWYTEEEKEYLRFHAQRISDTAHILDSFLQPGKSRLLDVGPHILTSAIYHLFAGRGVKISTLGWADHRLALPEIVEEHVEHNLNQELRGNEFKGAPFDVIVMAETIEHLYTAPKVVLRGLLRLLSPQGGRLLIQTPNAAALNKRYELILGRNPYEMIRENTSNPGHFREYTAQELMEIGQSLGLITERLDFMNYWRSPGWRGHLEDLFPKLRNGITVVFQLCGCKE
jgi:SAM-dependent methyltransferase